MEMKPVKSSQIKSVGYNPASKTLHVEFKTGCTYMYTDVPKEKYEALLAAPSAGSHFHANIRNVHAFTNLNEGKL